MDNLDEILKQVEELDLEGKGMGVAARERSYVMRIFRLQPTKIIRALVERLKEAEEVLSAHALLIKRMNSPEFENISNKALQSYLNKIVPMIEDGVLSYLEKWNLEI